MLFSPRRCPAAARRVRALAVLAAVLALSSCSRGAGSASPTASPSRAPSASPAPSPSPSGSASPSPSPSVTRAPKPRCANERAAAADPSLRRPGSLIGDVLGTGGTDHVFVADDPHGRANCRFFVVVSTGPRTLAAPVRTTGLGSPASIAALGLPALQALVGIGPGPGLAIAVEVWRGASTAFASLYAVQGGKLVPLTTAGQPPGSLPNAFGYGGSVGNLSGVDCVGGRASGEIVSSTASSSDGQSYAMVRVTLRLTGSVFHQVGQQRLTVPAANLSQYREFAGVPFPSCATARPG